MRLIKTLHDILGYVWVCPICFFATKVTSSTCLSGINIRLMDFPLSMWVRNSTPKITGKIA